MADFTGGYTGAINDAATRQAQDFTNRHLAQIIQQRMLEIAQQNELRQRQGQARTDVGSVLPDIFAPPPGGAPGMAPAPQSPGPGVASVPMEQAPTGPPPQAADFGQGPMPPGAPAAAMTGAASENSPSPEMSEPQAAPQPVGWQVSNAAGPEVGGTERASAQAAQATVVAPPQTPKMPPQLLSAPVLIDALAKRGITGERAVAALHEFEPIMRRQNEEAIKLFQAGVTADKIGEAARRQAFEAETKRLNVNSQIDRRTASADQGQQRLDISRQALDAKISAAQQKVEAQGGGVAGAGEELTAGGKAVAAELSRAGLPLPSGGRGGAAGIARSNMILNQMALDEEGGAGSGTIAGQRGAYKADAGSLAFQQKQVDSIERSSIKIEKDIKTLEDYIDSGTAGSVTLINKPINVLRTQFSDPKLTEFALAAKLVGVEYERMINGGLMSVAQLHEGAREDAAKLINENMTPEQIRRVLPVMRREIDNAKSASHEKLADIQVRMRQGVAKPAAGSAKSAPAAGGALPIQGGKPKPDGIYDSPAGRVRVKDGVATLIGS